VTSPERETRIHVDGDQEYDVVVGRALVEDAGMLRGLLGSDVRRVAVLHASAVAATAAKLAGDLEHLGLTVVAAQVPDGEAAKHVEVAARLWSELGRAKFTRDDAVIGMGGGATTDLAGFVAATWLRGISVVHVPTTLLGMVDAAVGGKTGINTAEGKNLVGAFHPPVGVVCDLDLLTTLPARDLASGLAEVVKAGFIADEQILALIEGDVAAVMSPTSGLSREIIERAIRVKAAVVAGDLKEHGGRAILNYGHTLGHAIEKVEAYSWRHGDAVSVGMVFAAELARAAGRLPEADVQRHRSILGAIGLPLSYRGDRWSELLDTMQVDKKSRGSVLRFVILDAVGSPSLLTDPAAAWLEEAYERVSA
jgi:3-dehydroquinate synthase